MGEIIVKELKNIAKYTPYHYQTLRRKYIDDMVEKGFIFKSRIGKKKRLTYWGYPDVVKKYFILQGQKKEII